MSISHRPIPDEKMFSREAERHIYQIKKVSRDYEVPYLAGYSRDGSTLYIDKYSARGFITSNGVKVDTDKYLCIHEYVEDSCLRNGATYTLGHAIASLAEAKAVEEDNVPLMEYNRFMDGEVRKAGSRKSYEDLPPDLDTRPYFQDHKSNDLLMRMGYLSISNRYGAEDEENSEEDDEI